MYLRYGFFHRQVGRIMSCFPTIVEINSDDLAEVKLNEPFLIYMYFRLTRHFLLSKAKGFIFVTEELRRKKSFSKYNKKAS